MYSLLAAKCGMRSFAFEPGDAARNSMKENVLLNKLSGSVYIIDKALSDWSGEGVLLEAHRPGVRKIEKSGDGTPIEVYRPDELDYPDPNIVKIDVEGEEKRVLAGMEGKLSSCRVIYVEIHDGVETGEIIQLLSDYGFRLTEEFGDDPILKLEPIHTHDS